MSNKYKGKYIKVFSAFHIKIYVKYYCFIINMIDILKKCK